SVKLGLNGDRRWRRIKQVVRPRRGDQPNENIGGKLLPVGVGLCDRSRCIRGQGSVQIDAAQAGTDRSPIEAVELSVSRLSGRPQSQRWKCGSCSLREENRSRKRRKRTRQIIIRS